MSARPIPARVAKLLPLLASDKPGEVVAAAAAIGRILHTAGQDWHVLAALVERQVQPALLSSHPVRSFSFATMPPRTARKAMVLLAGRPGVSAQQRAAMEALRT